MFVSLTPPFVPLKANSIGSLTRAGLKTLGIDTSVWKPHSTRGAGVIMMKKLGLSSEEVCEIGKWKNVAAFTSHYLRLNATDKVGSAISNMVHSVSPLRSAESDLTWTTGMQDLGGSVREDEAQSNGETRSSSPAVFYSFLGSVVPRPLSLFLAGGWRTFVAGGLPGTQLLRRRG